MYSITSPYIWAGRTGQASANTRRAPKDARVRWVVDRGREGAEANEKESLCVWDSCADEREGEGMQLQFVPLTVRGKNGYCLAGEKRIEPL